MHLNFTKIFCCIPAVKCQEMLLTHTRQIISKKYYYPICIPNVDVFSQKMTAVTFIIIDRLLIIYSSYLVLGKMKKKQRTLTSFVYTILDIHIYSYTSSIHNHACRRKWGKKRILIYWEIWKRLNIRTLFTFIFNLLFMKLMSFYLPRQTMWSTRRQKSLFSLSRSTSLLSRVACVTNEHFRYLISQRQSHCSTQYKHSTEAKRVEWYVYLEQKTERKRRETNSQETLFFDCTAESFNIILSFTLYLIHYDYAVDNCACHK